MPAVTKACDRLIVADAAKLAASLSSVLALRGSYLPIVDGPRMARPDAEITKRIAGRDRFPRSSYEALLQLFDPLDADSLDHVAQRLDALAKPSKFVVADPALSSGKELRESTA